MGKAIRILMNGKGLTKKEVKFEIPQDIVRLANDGGGSWIGFGNWKNKSEERYVFLTNGYDTQFLNKEMAKIIIEYYKKTSDNIGKEKK